VQDSAVEISCFFNNAILFKSFTFSRILFMLIL
jgi:hypothetical protein